MEVSQRAVLALIRRICGQDNVLTIPRVFIDMTGGDHVTALVLSQMFYWSERTKDPEGWFYKSAKEWHDELAISTYQLNKATKKLEAFGVQTRLARAEGAPTTHFRIDFQIFSKSIFEFLENGIPTDSQMDSQKPRKTLTETTTETTTKSVTPPTPPKQKTLGLAPTRDRDPDGNLDHPMVVMVREILGYKPTIMQRGSIVDTVTNESCWRDVLKYWALNNHRIDSIGKMIERYREQLPKYQKPASAQASDEPPFWLDKEKRIPNPAYQEWRDKLYSSGALYHGVSA